MVQFHFHVDHILLLQIMKSGKIDISPHSFLLLYFITHKDILKTDELVYAQPRKIA